jgi:protein-tyrosine phosphatase
MPARVTACTMPGVTAALGQSIDVPGVPNLRDLGGYPTRDGGRVRSGLLYRSTQLSQLPPGDPTYARLGIRNVYDLRTDAERIAEPDRLPDGAELVVLDVLRDHRGAPPAELEQILVDPNAAQALLGDGRATALFVGAYREIVSLDSALDAYRLFFADLAQARTPALFHCTTGKDRTGWGAAALLMLLEVPDELVMEDYLRSTDYLLAAYKPVLDQFEAIGGDPELLQPVIGVHEEYLAAALDEMCSRYGTIEGYFDHGLGLDADVQSAIRIAFVERD